MGLKLFVVLATVTVSLAWPWQSVERCGKTCTSMPGYEVNKMYTYDYSVTVSSLVNGTSVEESSVVIECKAAIQVVDNCEMILKISEVRIQEKNQVGSFSTSSNNEYFKTSLMSQDLRFSYDQGRISTVCPHDDEEIWVLNIKRGILSAFQGTSLQVMGTSEPEQMSMETDVTGICPVQLKKVSDDKTIKSKNFMGCKKHIKIDSSVQATQLLPHAPTMSILNSSQVCEQQWSDMKLQRALCEEKHLVKPFSKGENGALTTVVQFMQIADIETTDTSSNEPVNKKTDLLFEHVHKEDSFAKEQLVATLNDVCTKSASDIRPEAAELFAKVAFQMRKLEKVPLKEVLDTVFDDSLCSGRLSFKKFVVDALPVCESTACVGVMTDLIRIGDLEPKLVDAWIMSFAFLRHPTADMINDLSNLLMERDNDKVLYLSLSALMHQFCVENENCMDYRQVTKALDFFEDALGFDCNTHTDEEKFKVLLALKALGNSGQAVSIIPTLDRCFEQKFNPVDIRIASLEALRRIPCAKGNRDNMLDLFKDKKEDSEIRIEAFRGAMKCLDTNMMDKIKRQMAIETSDQVGSYVWSFLKNLNSSSDPLKQEHRAIVQESGLLRGIPMDPRKFSRNIEFSYFNDTTGLGATLESDVVFSSKSFIPRQVSVDSKLDLFGFSIDLLEVGGRVEGIQYLLESLVGPNGFFQDKGLMDLIMNPPRRQRRATVRDSTLNNLLENFDIQAEDMLKGSVYFKVFGNELGFADLSKLGDWTPGSGSGKILQYLMELAKEKTIEYSKNMMLMELSSEVPSCAGLPIKISVNGSTSLQLKASGKMDIRQAMVKPRSLDISGKIEPSAVIEVSTIMEVDCFVARTGIQHVARAHTSTSLEGSVVLTNGKVFKLNLNVPDRRLNIADVKSNIYLIRMEEMIEIQGSPDSQMNLDMCTGSKVEQYFGVALCGEASFPDTILQPQPNSPRFPLSGNLDIELYLEKRDASLTKYTMEASYEKKQKAVGEEVFITDIVHFMVGTPNTDIKRTYSVDMSLNRGEQNLTIDVVTPTKTASIAADFVKQQLMQKLEVLVFIDEAQVMKILSTMNIQPDLANQRVKFVPVFEFEFHNERETKAYRLAGSVTKDIAQHRTEIDLVFNKPSENLITLSGNVQKNIGVDKITYVTDLNLGGRYITARIDGEVIKMGNIVSSAITLEYVPTNQDSRTLNFTMKFTNNTSEKYSAYDFMTSMSFSQNPQFDFRIDSSSKLNALHSESSHRLCYGGIDCQADKIIAVEHTFDLTKSETNLENELEISVRLPAFKKEYRITQSLTRNYASPLNFIVDLDEIVNTTRLFHTKLNLNNEGTLELPRGSFIFEVAGPLREGHLTQTWNRISENRVSATTTLKTEADRTSTMAITWEKSERVEDEYKKHSINIDISTPEDTSVSVEYYIELSNGEMDTELTAMKNDDRIVFMKLELEDMSDSQKLKKELSLTCTIPSLQSLKDVSWVSELEYRQGSLFNFVSTLSLIQNRFVFTTNLRNKSSEEKKHGEFVISFATPENEVELFSSAKLRGKVISFETATTFTPGGQDGKRFAVKLDYNNNTDETAVAHQVTLTLEAPDQSVSTDCSFSRSDSSLTSIFSVTYAPNKTITNTLTFNDKSTNSEKILAVEMSTTTPDRSFGFAFTHRNTTTRYNPHLEISLTSGTVFTTDVVYEIKQNGAVKDLTCTFALPEDQNDFELNMILTNTNSGKGFELTVSQANAQTVRIDFNLVPMITEVDKEFDIALNLVNTYITGYDMNFDFIFAQKNMGASILVGTNITVNGKRQIELETSMTTMYSTELRRKVAYIFKSKLPQLNEEPLRNIFFNFTCEKENDDVSQYISFLYNDLSDNYKICMERLSDEQNLGMNLHSHHVLHFRHPFDLPNVPQDMSLDIRCEANDIERSTKVMYVRNGLTTTIASRYRNKTNDRKIHHMAELIISRPDEHAITIKGVGKLFDGNTMFSTDLDVSYSSDKKKDISFKLDLSNNTVAEYTSDYTLGMDVLHLFSNVDVTLACSFSNNTERGSIGLESQIAIDDDYIPIAFEGEFNKLSRKYTIHTNGPEREMWFRGQIVTISEGHYRLDMTNQYDQKIMPSFLEMDMINKEIQYKFMFDEEGEEYWKLTMGYFNDSALEADLTRMIRGQLTDDAHVRIVLTSPKVLRNEIHWRPEWIQNVNATIARLIERLSSSWSRRTSGMQARMGTFRGRIQESMEDFVQENYQYRTMYNELVADLRRKIAVFKSRVSARRLSMKNSIDAFKTDVVTQMTPSIVKMEVAISELESQIQELKQDLQMKMQMWVQNASISLANYKAQIGGRMIEELSTFAEAYNVNLKTDAAFIKQEVNATVQEIIDSEREHLNTLKLSLATKKEVLSQLFKELAATIKAVLKERFNEMKLNFKQSVFYSDLMIFVQEMERNELAADIMAIVEETLNDVKNSEDLLMLKALVTRIRQYRMPKIPMSTKWIEQLKSRMVAEIEKLKAQLYTEGQKYNSSLYSLEKFDIENGEIVFLLFLEDEWQSLTQWPEKYTEALDQQIDEPEYMASIYRRLQGYKKKQTLFSDVYLQSLKEKWQSSSANTYVDSYIQETDRFWSWFYMVKRLIQPKNLIPPYQGQAMIAGTEHFMTFDKSYFDFSNKCSYILASDFIDGNFTVIVDYDRTENVDARSLVVKVDDQTIEITPDWQVKKNDRVIELPVQFEKTTIIRDNGIIRIDNTNGVTVRCNLHSEYCTVNVTGWYFGKTGGLFGDYNYEKKDDLTKSNGRVTDNIPEFARSWQVGRKCRDHDNDAKQCPTDPKLPANEICVKIFLDFLSEFSRCFTQVDRNTFYKMCVNQKCGLTDELEIEKAVCNISNAYREQCKQQEVMLKPLKKCVMCEGTKNQILRANEQERLEKNDTKPKSADIVFVVEEKLCAQDVVNKLPDLADTLNTELKKLGLKENRFGLVGFGGPGIHDLPHMHTIDHQIFNHQRKLQLGIEGLEFGEGGNNDTFKALLKAANYPFRAGVAKNIILISCSQCKDTKISYLKISRTIIKRGINFNMLMSYNFTVKSGKDVNIYGIDERYAFTRKSSTENLGDADLRRLVKEPSSKCAVLAIESNGTIFNMQSINEKKFIDVLTQRMLQTTVPMECQVCKCVADKEGSGITICEKCFNPLMFTPYRPIENMQKYIAGVSKSRKPNKSLNKIKQ